MPYNARNEGLQLPRATSKTFNFELLRCAQAELHKSTTSTDTMSMKNFIHNNAFKM